MDKEEVKIITVREFLQIVWHHKIPILVSSFIGFTIGLVIAISIPDEFSTTVKLLPTMEGSINHQRIIENVMSNLDLSKLRSGNDGIDVYMYPDVIKSLPFVTKLFDIEVKRSINSSPITLEEYLQKNIKYPWWRKITSFPYVISGWFKRKRVNPISNDAKKELNLFRLSERESGIAGVIGSRIEMKVSQNSNIITIIVTMQDPLVAAIVADSVVANLEEYIVNYKRSKLIDNLKYLEKIKDETKIDYYSSQTEVANYEDTHNGIWSNFEMMALDSLKNILRLNYNNYIRNYNDFQKASLNLEGVNDAFFILEPSMVNLDPSSPKRFKIIITYSLIGFVLPLIWYLSLKPSLQKKNKDKKKSF